MDSNAKIGKKLKKIRKQMGMSQKEFGKKLGISGSFVGYIENNKRRVNPNLLKKISDLTGKPVSYFYGEKPKLDPTLEVFQIMLEEQQEQKRAGKSKK
ncbi:MAG: helix-turn-helix transcriptional regulator [Candidatus Spechtbacterales bacterium]|nr:helix-turn-helix transcriptional regulator [Candidatus Spechtbacterales bacterium]